MPTVLRDSSELIQLLDYFLLPIKDCFLVMVDAALLYPYVDIKTLIVLNLLLRKAGAPETPRLIQLARLVFYNSYLSSEFSPDIFHQESGIVMGTPFSVTAANMFMYHHEKDIVEHYLQYLTLYKQFTDDIFAIRCGPKGTLLEFLSALSNKNDHIKLTYYISKSGICLLYLFLFTDASSDVLQSSTFQKPLTNTCTYPLSRFTLLALRKLLLKAN